MLPHQIATLLYCFNERDEVLLLQRTQQPNLGLWSPPGGKLRTDSGESPYSCGCREAAEELGVELQPRDLHLTGLISEAGFEGQAHWLMFLFEVKPPLTKIPPIHREGAFSFFDRQNLFRLPLPQTDRDQIWPLFWRHRGGYFAAACRCGAAGQFEWTIEESIASCALNLPS